MPRKKHQAVDAFIGARVRLRRLMLGMSQEELSNQLGVTFQQIQKYEKGQNLINPINLLALTDYFNVSFDYWVKPIQNKNLTLLTKRRENGYSQVREWTHDRV